MFIYWVTLQPNGGKMRPLIQLVGLLSIAALTISCEQKSGGGSSSDSTPTPSAQTALPPPAQQAPQPAPIDNTRPPEDGHRHDHDGHDDYGRRQTVFTLQDGSLVYVDHERRQAILEPKFMTYQISFDVFRNRLDRLPRARTINESCELVREDIKRQLESRRPIYNPVLLDLLDDQITGVSLQRNIDAQIREINRLLFSQRLNYTVFVRDTQLIFKNLPRPSLMQIQRNLGRSANQLIDILSLNQAGTSMFNLSVAEFCDLISRETHLGFANRASDVQFLFTDINNRDGHRDDDHRGPR